MNYNKLRYFYEVCKSLNITKTSQQLYISQPALSKQMTELEKELGVKLFIRTNRSLRLTKAGQALNEECEIIFSRENEILRRVQEASTKESGSLQVVSMGIEMAFEIQQIISSFQVKYTAIDVRFHRLNWDRVLKSVEDGTADIGIKLSINESYSAKINWYTLRHSNLAVVLPSTHALIDQEFISLHQLKSDRFIMLSKDDSSIPFEYTMHLCKESGFIPNITAIYPNVETVVMMVQAGAGIALLSPFAPLKWLHETRCIPIQNAPPINMDIIWNTDISNFAIELFVNYVKRRVITYR